jgi:hypothetical protein
MERIMPAMRDFIVKDTEILGGTPVFGGPESLSRRYLTTWKAGRLSKNS